MLVVEVAGAPAPARRRLRRARPRDSDPDAGPATVPVSTLTAVRPQPLGDRAAAESWLRSVRDSSEAVATELAEALAVINRAVHAQRTATVDPHLHDVSAERALAARIGFGTGDELAEGRYSEAIEIPASARRRRIEALRPQERVAAVLGGGASISPAEDLLLRARADLDGERPREAALQLRVGLEALLAEPRDGVGDAEANDLEALEGRRAATGDAATEALRGALSGDRAAEVAETVRLCERVLRRRRLT